METRVVKVENGHKEIQYRLANRGWGKAHFEVDTRVIHVCPSCKSDDVYQVKRGPKRSKRPIPGYYRCSVCKANVWTTLYELHAINRDNTLKRRTFSMKNKREIKKAEAGLGKAKKSAENATLKLALKEYEQVKNGIRGGVHITWLRCTICGREIPMREMGLKPALDRASVVTRSDEKCRCNHLQGATFIKSLSMPMRVATMLKGGATKEEIKKVVGCSDFCFTQGRAIFNKRNSTAGKVYPHVSKEPEKKEDIQPEPGSLFKDKPEDVLDMLKNTNLVYDVKRGLIGSVKALTDNS